MNRPWEDKSEGVDMGAAVPKVFPHQMMYRGSKGARRKGSRPPQHMHTYVRASSWTLQHMHTYACAFWVDFGLISLDFPRFPLIFI